MKSFVNKKNRIAFVRTDLWPVLLFVLGIGLTLWSKPSLANGVVSVEANDDAISLFQHCDAVFDPTGEWTIADVQRKEIASTFRPYFPKDGLPPPVATISEPGVYWLRFTLKMEAPSDSAEKEKPEEWRLLFPGWVLFKDFRVYAPDFSSTADASYEEISFSDMKKNGLPLSVLNQTPIPVRHGPARDYYVRIENHFEIPPYMELIRAPSLGRKQFYEHHFQGGYVGVVLTVLLLNLCLFVYFRDRSYMWYMIFHGAFFLSYAINTENIFDYFPEFQSYPLFFSYLVLVLIFVISASGVLFSRSFLSTARYLPRLDRVNIAYVAILCLSMAALLFIPGIFSMVFSPLQFLGMLILCSINGILSLRAGFKPARFFVVAWGVYVVGMLFTMFVVLILGIMEISLYVAQIGSALEAMLLTVALVDRMKTLQKDKVSAVRAKDRAEIVQKESEERLRFALDATNDGIWDWNINEDVFYMSPRCYAMLGYEPGEWTPTDENLIEALGEEAFRKHQERMNQFKTRHTDTPKSMEVTHQLKRKDGKTVWVLDRGSIVEMDDQGNPTRMVGTFVDVTERRRFEEQLYRTDKLAALGQIMAGVAHEINNPNNFIYFNLPILKRYMDALKPYVDEYYEQQPNLRLVNMPYDFFWEDADKLMENMQHGSKRITSLVNELKDYVRSHESNEQKAHNVDELVKHVRVLAEKQIRKTVKRFDVEVASELPEVWMDAGKIEQVLINLIINACHAADKPDAFVTLKIHPSTRLNYVRFAVEDNGCGIDEENTKNIFDPFFTTKDRDKGTGLGLAISQKIIREHDAEIELSSTVGEGTSFAFELRTAASVGKSNS